MYRLMKVIWVSLFSTVLDVYLYASMILWRQLFWTFFKNLIIILASFLLVFCMLNLYFCILYSIMDYITAVYSNWELQTDSSHVDITNFVKASETVIFL